MADIPEEHLTEELLDRLLASASIEQYLDEGLVSARTLTDYLFDRMEAHDLRRADVVRASGLNATVVYDIFSGKSRPGRDHAIMLAFGLKCTLRETQRLLRLAGVSELWCKQRRRGRDLQGGHRQLCGPCFPEPDRGFRGEPPG